MVSVSHSHFHWVHLVFQMCALITHEVIPGLCTNSLKEFPKSAAVLFFIGSCVLCDILVSSRKDHPSDLNYDCCINAASPQGFLLQRWETSDSFLFYTRWRLQCLQAQKLLAENLVSRSLHWIRVLSALLDVKSQQPKQYIQRDRQTSGPTDEMVLIKVVTVASHCGWNLFIGKQTCLILQAMTFYEESENSTRDTHSQTPVQMIVLQNLFNISHQITLSFSWSELQFFCKKKPKSYSS